MQVDRELQKNILVRLKGLYPRPRPFNDIYRALNRDYPGWDSNTNDSHDHLVSNLFYLREHGLIDGTVPNHAPHEMMEDITATKSGIDFIEQDGGLSAILGVVTVRLHTDTIHDLVATKIDESDAPEEEKSWMRNALGTLKEEGYRTLSKELMKYAWENKAIAWHTLKEALTQAMGG